MAIVYCDDGGSNTSPYDTWAKAATVFGTAVTQASAGDDIYIGADHSELLSANATYTFAGTASAPVRVISVTVGTSTYNKADNIQIDTNGGNRDITINGFVKFYGVSLVISDDFTVSDSPQAVLFDDCLIEMERNGSAVFIIGDSAANVLTLKNTDINFSSGGATSGFNVSFHCDFSWLGGVLFWTGTQPTALFNNHNRSCVSRVAGVDLSAITSALVDVSDAADMLHSFHHCLLNSSVSLTTGTINRTGTKILMSGCDDTTGNDLYRLEYVDFYGSVVHDDAIYRTSGASDGATNISWKMVTTGNATEFSEPLISPPIVAWVDATGSTTFTVHLNWDNATDLDNDEIWLEVEYLSASADTESDFFNNGMADILATPAAQTTSTEGWTGTGGFTNENKQQLDVTVTVNRVGPVICRVHLAKPSVTVYVDPKVEVA